MKIVCGFCGESRGFTEEHACKKINQKKQKEEEKSSQKKPPVKK